MLSILKTISINTNRQSIASIGNQLMSEILNGDYENARTRMSQISELQPPNNNDLIYIKYYLFNFFTRLASLCMDYGLSENNYYDLLDNHVSEISNIRTIEEITPYIDIKLRLYTDFFSNNQREKHSFRINQIRRYVEQHIYDSINVKAVAEGLGLHPNYVSRIFKEEMKRSLGSYIHLCKMDLAKSLLLTTEKSINEIAISLGYTSHTYFSAKFKAVIGMTPIDYRNQDGIQED